MSLVLRCRPSRTLQEFAYTLPVSHGQTVKLILRRTLAHVQKTVREDYLDWFHRCSLLRKELVETQLESTMYLAQMSVINLLDSRDIFFRLRTRAVYQYWSTELDLPIGQGYRRVFQKSFSLPFIHVSYSSDTNVNTLKKSHPRCASGCLRVRAVWPSKPLFLEKPRWNSRSMYWQRLPLCFCDSLEPATELERYVSEGACHSSSLFLVNRR